MSRELVEVTAFGDFHRSFIVARGDSKENDQVYEGLIAPKEIIDFKTIRCQYCGQKNLEHYLCCDFCGGRL